MLRFLVLTPRMNRDVVFARKYHVASKKESMSNRFSRRDGQAEKGGNRDLQSYVRRSLYASESEGGSQ